MSEFFEQLPLSRFSVNRAASLRADKNWLSKIWASDDTRVLILKDGQLPVTDELSLILVKPSHLNLSSGQVSNFVALLGVEGDKTFLAYFTDEDNLNEASWVSLREVGAGLSTFDVGLATTATALGAWHSNHQHCAKCGAKTLVTSAGWSRTCPKENYEHFPRTEPAMIVAVRDKLNRILLGRRSQWPQSWFSTLAGFVEAGENVEACVVREVFEESGINVDPDSLRYLGSQPWPFPASLMFGYVATAINTEIKSDGDEMAEVRWFSRDEFIRSCEQKTLQIPNSTTIAHHLIAHWYGEPIPKTWCR